MEHAHVERLVLLRKLPRIRCLNDAPFRLLHILAFSIFCYFYFSSPAAQAGNLESGPTGSEFDDEVLDTQQLAEPAVSSTVRTFEDLDELDGIISTAEFNSTAEGKEVPDFEVWEPKAAHDYVLVVWAIVALSHALVNLFCVWAVRVKVFCQYGRVRTLAEADHVLCKPTANHGKPAIAEIVTRELSMPGEAGAPVQTVRASFRLSVFVATLSVHACAPTCMCFACLCVRQASWGIALA